MGGIRMQKVGIPPEQVFKTLVARGDRQGVCFAVVPGDSELDLKALAQLSGNRSIDTVPLKEVQPLTGYIRGGVTVLGAKKAYPVYADETIELFDRISVSSGARGAQLILAPADYLRAVKATIGAIGRPFIGYCFSRTSSATRFTSASSSCISACSSMVSGARYFPSQMRSTIG
jgi:Cys-tRNA(Pro)/Cys-tRNA(Cys) deacylase